MQSDLTGLIIKKLGDNYVNVNQETRKREKEKEKNSFLSTTA